MVSKPIARTCYVALKEACLPMCNQELLAGQKYTQFISVNKKSGGHFIST